VGPGNRDFLGPEMAVRSALRTICEDSGVVISALKARLSRPWPRQSLLWPLKPQPQPPTAPSAVSVEIPAGIIAVLTAPAAVPVASIVVPTLPAAVWSPPLQSRPSLLPSQSPQQWSRPFQLLSWLPPQGSRPSQLQYRSPCCCPVPPSFHPGRLPTGPRPFQQLSWSPLQRSQPSQLPPWLPNLQSRPLVAWPRPPTLQSRLPTVPPWLALGSWPPTVPPWLALGSWPPTHGHFRPLRGPSCPRPGPCHPHGMTRLMLPLLRS
jgi:hypothetical protein